MLKTLFTDRMRLIWLLLGAATGLVLAASGLVQSGSRSTGPLPEHIIARVGDRLIPEERYEQLLSDLAADKRGPLKAADRQFVLDRLIDEELLVMRGSELGLDKTAPEIRKALAASVISQVAAEAEAAVPDEAALRQLYSSDAEYFTSTGRYQLRWWRLPGSGKEAERQALAAWEQLNRKIPIEAVSRSTGLQPESMLPDQMLPLNKLADYLGPVLAQRVPQLKVGSYSRPIAADGSFNILYLVARKAGALPAFEQIRPMVQAEYLRRAGDKALREYLGWLRSRTQIVVRGQKAD